MSPHGGLHKKAVEFALTVRPQQHGGEARYNAIPFSDKHPARGDLVEWKLDGIRVGKQSVAVIGIIKRGPPLQGFESLLLGHRRDTDR